jgi:hypothetical protein
VRDECPHCGAELPPNAKACPECGSDEQTGWSEAAQQDGLGIPDESFDYQDFIEREFEGKAPASRRSWFWWVIALILLAALAVAWLRR